jgi:molecular chaperone DnaK
MELFSTAEDNQPAVKVKVYQGERELAGANKLLGEFNLEGIPPSPRGMPQIEVTFDIDANGILHVSARDKASGKENKITIKANSGLTEDEVRRMVKDAELHAEDDRKLKELTESRNQGDALVHAASKTLQEAGTEGRQAERERVESAIRDLEAALKGNSKADIDAKCAALSTALQMLSSQAFSGAQAATEPADEPAHAQGHRGADDDVIDADFREVKR